MAPSQVWQYFKKVEGGRKAKCSICKKVMVFCGSTSSLAGHLAKTHKINTPKQCLKTANKDKQNVVEFSGEESCDSVPSGSQETIALEINSPIIQSFQKAATFSRDGDKTCKINDALLYMIAVDNMPFCTPEKRGFQKFIKTLQPLYKAPALNTRDKLFDGKYTHLKAQMFQRLGSTKHITITTDLWTETMRVKSFLGLTAHYIDGTVIKSVDIGATQISQRKIIDNLKQALKTICELWHISENKVAAIVTDNGPNMVGASKEAFGADKHLPCFAHTLNLVVTKSIDFYNLSPGSELAVDEDSDQEEIADETDASKLKTIVKKLKRIVAFFKRSESASTALNNMQQVENCSQHCKRLIQEVRTRWNSLYEMINRYLEIHEPVSSALRKITTEKISRSKPPKDLTTEEVECLMEVKKLLKPFFLVTQELCSEKNVTISKIIPLIKLLNKSIEVMLPIGTAAFELRRKLISNMNDKFKNIEKNSMLSSATILDPRFKKLHFSSDDIVKNIISKIAIRVKEKFETITSYEQSHCSKRARNECNPGDSLLEFHDSIVETQKIEADQDVADGIPVELRQYLNRPVCDRNMNPLEEWEKYKPIYPHIYEIAREYLGILATSVPCERLFSKAGLIITKLRNRLSSKHLNQQLFFQNLSEEDWFE